MTKVLVHGNPETKDVWRLLVAALAERGVDDVATLDIPGFGAPVPEGFAGTQQAYADWLADTLAGIDGPVDLVGHDWGSGHVLGIVADRPDLIRSWAVDIIGLAHPDYVWHDAAQGWRTPDVGEEMVAGMAAAGLDDKVALFESFGMPNEIASDVAPWVNDDMAASILSLYRSADPADLQALADRVVAADGRPGLALSALDDPYVAADLAPATAERFGARLVELAGQGHWWMLEDQNPAADALVDFWASL